MVAQVASKIINVAEANVHFFYSYQHINLYIHIYTYISFCTCCFIFGLFSEAGSPIGQTHLRLLAI